MTTAETLHEKALSLARAGVATEEAVRDLLESCGERRVPVVLARQQLHKELDAPRPDPLVLRAAELLDGVLARLPVT